ncbi:hypothetical protein ACRAWD_04615 [Caulobacter segnis]
MLYRIAMLFGLPIDALFDGLPSTARAADGLTPGLNALFETGGGRAWPKPS